MPFLRKNHDTQSKDEPFVSLAELLLLEFSPRMGLVGIIAAGILILEQDAQSRGSVGVCAPGLMGHPCVGQCLRITVEMPSL